MPTAGGPRLSTSTLADLFYQHGVSYSGVNDTVITERVWITMAMDYTKAGVLDALFEPRPIETFIRLLSLRVLASEIRDKNTYI